MKTLFFEGAGCVPCGEVENCRMREVHRNVNKEVNGLEAWIISAPWGCGVRFYSAGIGYPGMADNNIKEINLIERL